MASSYQENEDNKLLSNFHGLLKIFENLSNLGCSAIKIVNSYLHSKKISSSLIYTLSSNEQGIYKSKSQQFINSSKLFLISENKKYKTKTIIEKNKKKFENNNLKVSDKMEENIDKKEMTPENKVNLEHISVNNNENKKLNKINVININKTNSNILNTNYHREDEKEKYLNLSESYIKNKLNYKPPRANQLYTQKLVFNNENIFSNTNESLGNISNKTVTSPLLCHLMIQNEKMKNKIIPLSIAVRTKSKITMLIYYSKVDSC